MIPFVKTQALGNDFILIEDSALAGHSDHPGLARRICHRQFGVGADGLIVWKASGDRFPLHIFNQDGSEAECSGNGLRCLAAYLIESGKWSAPEIRLETISGLYKLRRVGDEYEADMGVPIQTPPGMVNQAIVVDGESLRVTACSTGNPHCSLFVDRLDDSFVTRIGPKLEHFSAFPNRTNVEFIHVLNDREIEVAFWERGVGKTFASGTGSCGATVACILNGKTGRSVTVHTQAGKLQVEWPEGGRLNLTASAKVVADGRYLEQ